MKKKKNIDFSHEFVGRAYICRKLASLHKIEQKRLIHHIKCVFPGLESREQKESIKKMIIKNKKKEDELDDF
jgi:hypothetical protein